MDSKDVKPLFDSKFIKVFDLQYADGKHYYDATRRDGQHLAAVKSEDEFRHMLPDAVSCFVILRTIPAETDPSDSSLRSTVEKRGIEGKDDGSRLLLSYEFRYPAGQYLLSVPAGLIDPVDEALAKEGKNPILEAARREIHEETNLTIRDTDRLEIINPLVFSTPGMTDESNALVLAVVGIDDLSVLNQNGAVGSEKFDGFVLLSEEDAKRILKNGVDDHGHFYPLYTWAAMMYFISGIWK